MGNSAKVCSNRDKMINYLRSSVFIINALFTVIAACIFIIGTNVSNKYSNYESFLNNYHLRTVQMLSVSGIISTFLALLGMLGAAKYNPRCLNIQNIFLIALLIMELVVIFTGIFILVNVKEPIETKMFQSIAKVEIQEKVRNSWNYIQENSHCCGVNSHDDWNITPSKGINSNSTFSNNGDYKKYPLSCCDSYNCSGQNLFKEGCIEHIVDYVGKSMKVITFVPVAVMILQVLLITLSCFLLKNIRQSKLLQEDPRQYKTRKPQSVSFFISSTSLLDRSRM